MRLAPQKPDQVAATAVLRARLRETHGDEAATAPFLHDWELRTLPCGRQGLHGLCYGHPDLGDAIMTTTAITQLGDGYARTESGGRLYLLGRESREHRRRRTIAGRRGPLRIGLPSLDPELETSPCAP